MARGVAPTSRSLTNTRAPAGRESTTRLPAPLAFAAGAGAFFSGTMSDALGLLAVNRTLRSTAEKPSRATWMLYDPSAKSRTVSGVLPRASPFTVTVASAGVDRITTCPRPTTGRGAGRAGGAAVTPDAGRDGAGAGNAGSGGTGTGVGAGTGAAADGGAAGRSTVVDATTDFVCTGCGGVARRDFSTYPARRPTARPTIRNNTIARRRWPVFGSDSTAWNTLGGWASHEAGNGDAGGSCFAATGTMTGSSGATGSAKSNCRSATAPGSAKRSNVASGSSCWINSRDSVVSPAEIFAARRNLPANSPAREGRAFGSSDNAAANASRSSGPSSALNSSQPPFVIRRPEINS